MLRMEDVRRGRIVDDDGILEVSAYLGKVLHQVSFRVASRIQICLPLHSCPGDCNSSPGKDGGAQRCGCPVGLGEDRRTAKVRCAHQPMTIGAYL